MPNTPLLTVTIVVQDQKDVIETTLTSLYECSDIPLELYVIDDASSDGSDQVIESVLDYYQHEQTFYFQHEQAAGRGYCLNEALLQCSGTIFWAPNSINQLDEELFLENLDRLHSSYHTALLQRAVVPSEQAEWLGLIKQDQWPVDESFIWNLSKIPAQNRYFSPHIDSYCGLELAARLQKHSYLQSEEPWSRPNSLAEVQPPNSLLQQEILFSLLRGTTPHGDQRADILEELWTLKPNDRPLTERDFDIDLLNEAVKLIDDGRLNTALEKIEEVLAERPSHPAAKQLKIKILERKRRFVEASELKHEVNRDTPTEPEQKENENQPETPVTETTTTDSEEVVEEEQEAETAAPKSEPEISLIIPTTIYGKGALEHCLVSISEHCNTDNLQLIVIDNASLDDTHDYLQELQEKQFLQCKIITNNQNNGFPASVNQGLEEADTPYACIMHNDIEFTSDALTQLKALMEDHPEYALIGPATNKTYNPEQASRNIEASSPGLVETEYIDSFCMMVRTESGLRLDKAYELAFFEDIDLSFQARTDGYKVGVAPHIEVTHHLGTTTFPLDLDTESKQYWKNVAYFNEKWGIEKFSEEELKSLGPFDQLLALDELANPLYPEQEIIEEFERLFTDEMKTEIFNSDHDAETLCQLVHLFMVMDKREVMRRLEDRLEGIELPASLIYQLVRFYYNRNIYSRCIHYLDQLKPQNESLRADLYRLAIQVENKNFDEAIPMLRHLMDHAPANPTLYKLAGDIHKFNGNAEEAASFHKLAKQINPFRFDKTPTDAFGFEL
ncbi:glycosyltransferase [Fodinibius salsisoli]|uniref:Glycosyltransferase n=1 Tax=Fodinibius salsisoli TaxID=2820877 RepID=A0ABT3PLU1_9BACT|nr:glycosyltransferase [Fodinibius salsisoli]MCW9706920.1 glycosyltransferase [Fodinibius salsisoli]